jgi:ribonuclease III family protein
VEKGMMNIMDKISEYTNLSEIDIRMLNPLIWAYIGDAIYEAYVRSYIISSGKRTSHDLHKMSIKFVKASAQSDFLEKILPLLSEEEQDVVRRGRNTKTYHVPKNADVIDYRRATAFEGLIGYLYLMKRYDRLDEIIKLVFEAAL